MVTPFIIWKYSIVYNEKLTMVWVFIWDTKIKIPSKFKYNLDLYTYILKKSWLTSEELDDKLWKKFTFLINKSNKCSTIDNELI